jgi:hypothetical protein
VFPDLIAEFDSGITFFKIKVSKVIEPAQDIFIRIKDFLGD